MVKIGDFARIGQVSVRMLRHYDAIGLLIPDRVDPWSGHRTYAASQLERLNRIVALKELGFTLDEVRALVDGDPAFLPAMLRSRRDALAADASTVERRLAAVTFRLNLIESENVMNDVVIKHLDPLRIVSITTTVHSQEEIGRVVGPMFGQLGEAMGRAGLTPSTGITLYSGDEEAMAVTVGFPVPGGAEPIAGTEILDLPAADAACLVHLGAMGTISESWQALSRWWDQNGYEASAPCREVYLVAGDQIPQSEWVTELQQPVAPGA